MKHVVFASDRNYLPHLATALLSLCKNNPQDIYLHLVVKDFLPKDVQKLEELVFLNSENKIHFYLLTDQKIDQLMGVSHQHANEKMLFVPVLLSKILASDIEKVAFFDADGVVEGDISELFSYEVPYVGGVVDIIEDQFRSIMPGKDVYVNTGMLILNLKAWRKEKITEQCMTYITKQKGYVPHIDQELINVVLQGKKTILPNNWNVLTPHFLFSYQKIKKEFFIPYYYSKEEFQKAKSHPAFIHFTPSIVGRPWMTDCKHPKVSMYKNYRLQTDFPLTTEPDQRNKNLRLLEKIYHFFGEQAYFLTLKLLKVMKGGR